MQDKTLDILFEFVINVCKFYNIDESHALKHSMQVYQFSKQIYKDEVIYNSQLKEYEDIIYISSILHDMIDDKYSVNISKIKKEITKILTYSIKDIDILTYSIKDIDIIFTIIQNMSYSKISKYGIPDLGKLNDAFNIVRDADLLAGYDIERAIIFGMYNQKLEYIDSLKRSKEMMKTRMLNYKKDHIKTNKAKEIAEELHKKLEYDIKNY